MSLGRNVGLGPGHIVLDGDPDPLQQRGKAPSFRSMSIVTERSPISATAEQLNQWSPKTKFGVRRYSTPHITQITTSALNSNRVAAAVLNFRSKRRIL